MDDLLIEVYLPANGKTYQLRIPGGMNTLLAASLTAKALAQLSRGCYAPSHNSVFAWRDSGKLLDMRLSMRQAQVNNGSSLLLI